MAPNFRDVDPPVRHYDRDAMGGLCVACGLPIPAALAGMAEHPCCDPDWPPMLAALQRHLALPKADMMRYGGTTPPAEGTP